MLKDEIKKDNQLGKREKKLEPIQIMKSGSQ
jgi:hypothetical protein